MTYLQIQAEVDKADALLNTAADLINGGHIVSIASLNEIVNNICSLIKEEGYAHCQALKPILIHLSDQMDQIRIVMENQLELYITEG
ncbi:MAG: hypothetical protein IJ846_06945 [Alphaproteobacteria bacterium]|nr:hypothetical protein [Alphaproteobacteria bacterium]